MSNLSNKGLLFLDLANYKSLTGNVYQVEVKRIEYLTEIVLLNGIIPYTFWNVRSNFNNILYIDDLVNPVWTITITPDKIYTFTTLAAEIQSQLIAIIGAGWTCSFDSLTYKFTIASGAGNFSIITTSSIYNARLLGYSSSANLTGAATYSSTLLPIMQSTRYITIHSKTLSNHLKYSYQNINTKNNDMLIGCVTITDKVFGDLINYQPTIPFNFRFDPHKEFIELIDIYFKDEFGNIINFNSIHPVLNFIIKPEPKYIMDRKFYA